MILHSDCRHPMLAHANSLLAFLALAKEPAVNPFPLDWVNIAVGAALLALGRKLFWLFVAGVGFAVGSMLATKLFEMHSPAAILVLSLAFGLLGALLAIFLQKLAIGLAGFFAGIYVANIVWQHSIWADERWAWLAILAGGLLAALLVLVLFDWALIFISSAIGALLIAETIPLSQPEFAAAIAIVLWLLGVGIQFSLFRRPKPANPA